MSTVGFIGVGNMGSAMISGISKRNHDIKLYAYDVDKSKTSNLDSSINIAESLIEICQKSKYIVLSVKPQFYPGLFKEIKNCLTKEHIIITVAPGYSIAKVKLYLGNVVRVVRAMPNTPALVGEGMTSYSFLNDEITEDEHNTIKGVFSSFGKSVKIDESNMEAIIATTGSSPAYAYLFIEAMADAAVSFGIPRDDAYMLSAQALKGAAQMVLDTKEHPAKLKDAVCSPGGTTIEAVLKLEETQFRNSIIKAMTACYNKANKMNKE
ncbi:MAG: pyrroline-5-carboxylate reductase [Epulopiscium sp.]|nr:pyrroline-5-carboxylate reductase [Candidatus Epulonipiscium sp.]